MEYTIRFAPFCRLLCSQSIVDYSSSAVALPMFQLVAFTGAHSTYSYVYFYLSDYGIMCYSMLLLMLYWCWGMRRFTMALCHRRAGFLDCLVAWRSNCIIDFIFIFVVVPYYYYYRVVVCRCYFHHRSGVVEHEWCCGNRVFLQCCCLIFSDSDSWGLCSCSVINVIVIFGYVEYDN